MALDGLIFDLDGTLVDTNALHVEAWRRAFADRGYRVGFDRIVREIGKGGDQLVPAVLGNELDGRDGDALRDAHSREFKRLAEQRSIDVFPAARELVRAVRERGVKVALSTSSAQEHLRTIERHAKIELRPMFDEIVTAADVEHSKPAPDAIVAGVRMLGVAPAQYARVSVQQIDAMVPKAATEFVDAHKERLAVLVNPKTARAFTFIASAGVDSAKGPRRVRIRSRCARTSYWRACRKFVQRCSAMSRP